MGRPSKLTDAQWEQVGKRLLAGESTSALAREFGVSKTAISVRFSKRNETIKIVANQIVETERALSKLNVSEQMAARSLADSLKDISEHLAGAARYGAMTAHRLAGIAAQQVEKVDDAEPLTKSMQQLLGVQALTKMANGASEIGLNLLRANKEALEDASRGKKPAPAGLNHFYGESDDTEQADA